MADCSECAFRKTHKEEVNVSTGLFKVERQESLYHYCTRYPKQVIQVYGGIKSIFPEATEKCGEFKQKVEPYEYD